MQREQVERKCILEGVVKPISQLLRFVELNNELLPDFNKKLPAKGMYVTANKLSLQKALQKKLFHKVSKHNLKIAEDFMNTVENLIKHQTMESLNLARKSGALITGFEKVKEAIKKGNVAFIIEAKDAALDGKEKVVLFAKNIEIFNLFSIDELDKALNKVNTVHIAILRSNISVMVYGSLMKYQNYIKDGENNE